MHRILSSLLLCAAAGAQAQTTVALDLVDATGATRAVGTVALSDSPHGLVLVPALQGLPQGMHGFHVHDKDSCAPSAQGVPAGAAGGHYDPQGTGRHGTPWGDGHLGDLPALYVDGEGRATMPVLAPRLRLADVAGRALMVHAGGDNHADHPAPLGGGAARIACGVIGSAR
ncbi:MAG: superoxide dismutase family protein [Burkholderiaceae bacterium]|nr:MAG: superoxide dismutase family protein [Burkholderiaceae bacterium]